MPPSDCSSLPLSHGAEAVLSPLNSLPGNPRGTGLLLPHLQKEEMEAGVPLVPEGDPARVPPSSLSRWHHTGFFAVSQTFQQHSPLGHCPCCSLYLEHFGLNIHITHASLPSDHCSSTPYVQSMLKKDSSPHSGRDCTSRATLRALL